MRELADPGHLDARLVAAGDEALEQRALPDPLPDPNARPRGAQLLRTEGALDEGKERTDDDEVPRPRPPRSASTLSRSADSSCSGSARSRGRAARSGSVRTWLPPTHATRSSARRCASSSVRATTTIGREAARLARRTARCAGRAAAGTRRTPGCGRWGRRASTSAATRRSPPRDEGMQPEWYRGSVRRESRRRVRPGPAGPASALPRARRCAPARAGPRARGARQGSSASAAREQK